MICSRCKSEDVGKPLHPDSIDRNIYKCYRCGFEGELQGCFVVNNDPWGPASGGGVVGSTCMPIRCFTATGVYTPNF